MCFNAQKNYLAGWFDDRKVSVNPRVNGAWCGTLIPPVDYAVAVAVVNVGNLYFQLNSAKKFNNETKANPNKINIVSAGIPSNPNTLSWLKASLAAGESYTYANFDDSGVALVIQVCSISFGVIDIAKVSIYLKNGVQKSLCDKTV
jgi:tripartite-type tricarboxylate transporter receptor subunit TctC